jgi:hypothetical protein
MSNVKAQIKSQAQIWKENKEEKIIHLDFVI